MPRENLLTVFDDFSRFAKDAAVVYRRGSRRESWTYAELAEAALACAEELQLRGVRTGDRVLIWGPNSGEWMAAFWGCLLRGAIAVPMDEGATQDFVMRVISNAQVRFAFVGQKKEFLSLEAGCATFEELRELSKSREAFENGDVPRGTLGKNATLADKPLTRSDIAQILFTSGTTAEPRGVVLTHGNFLANLEPLERGIDEYRKYEKWLHPLRFVSLVPLSHVFGQFMGLFVPPLIGATIVFERSNHAGDVVKTIQKEKASLLVAVPRMLDTISEEIAGKILRTDGIGEGTTAGSGATKGVSRGPSFYQKVWTHRKVHRRLGWRFWAFVSGGSALSSRTERRLKKLGYAVVQGYGMTETASLISLNHPFRAAEGSVGKVLPGREFKLTEDGEILLRGENVSAGYWEKNGLQKSDEEGWLHTGDLGEIDSEGNLKFRGRKKSVIVTPAGLNVYPEDIEAAAKLNPNIRDCVVIALEKDGNAEPCAVFLPNYKAELRPEAPDETLAEAISLTNKHLAEYQQVRNALLWPDGDFPRTGTGKPRVNVIAARTREILAAKGEARKERHTIADFLKGAPLSESLRAVTSEESLASLSSLDRVELLSVLEQRYDVELNETEFAGAKTVEDLKQLVANPSVSRSSYEYPGWTQTGLARMIRLIVYYTLVWPATILLGHARISGREKLKDLRGPAIVVSNHITRRADIGLILAALPVRFRHQLATAMGGETLLKMRTPPKKWFFAKRWAYQLGYGLVTLLFNVFPLPQFSGFRESLRFAADSVDRGYSVLIFPEGEVNNSEDGRMAAFQPGIGLFAENLRLPIVPMRLDGVWKMKSERRRLAHRGEITVRIGDPVSFSAETSPEEIARRLQEIVLAL